MTGVVKPTEPQVPLAEDCMTHCFRTQWEELENIQILNEFFEQKRREKSNALL